MRIFNKDYSVVVAMLMLPEEFEVAKIAVESVINSVINESNVLIVILLNGKNDKKIINYFNLQPKVKIYCLNKNLGVSQGRNYLFKQPEVITADIILSIDSDSYLPIDYVREMCKFLCSQVKAGIVGPTMIMAKDAKKLLNINFNKRVDKIRAAKVTSKTIKDAWMLSKNRDSLYHMGIKHWFILYCSKSLYFLTQIINLLNKKKIIKKKIILHIKEDPKIVDYYKAGVKKIEVATVPGGGQVFFSKLLREIGLLEPAFSPWGFEDSEFSIRALKAGKKNYTSLENWYIHGTKQKMQKKSKARSKYTRSKYTMNKGKMILLRKIIDSKFLLLLLMIEHITWSFLVNLFNYNIGILATRSVQEEFKGIYVGLTTKLSKKSTLINEAQQAYKKAAF